MRQSFLLVSFLTFAVICCCHAQTAEEQPITEEQWEQADLQTRRLPPTAFPELPGEIVRELVSRGCTIPQTFASSSPENIIRGEFAKPEQQDWAVLCSVNRVSSILIFWGGSTHDVAEVYTAPDKSELQGIGGGRIGYSRAISTVGKEYIESHYAAYRDGGAPEPPPIDHEGINDAFIEKASTVHYFYQGKWLELAGAD